MLSGSTSSRLKIASMETLMAMKRSECRKVSCVWSHVCTSIPGLHKCLFDHQVSEFTIWKSLPYNSCRMQVIQRPIRIYKESSRPKGSLQCREFFEGEESESMISYQRQLDQCFVEFFHDFLSAKMCKVHLDPFQRMQTRILETSWSSVWTGTGKATSPGARATWAGQNAIGNANVIRSFQFAHQGGNVPMTCPLRGRGSLEHVTVVRLCRGMLTPVDVAASASAAVHCRHVVLFPWPPIPTVMVWIHMAVISSLMSPMSPFCLNGSKWPHSICASDPVTELKRDV